MEAFLPDSVKAILLALLVIVFAVAWLARALPHVAWLQPFRFRAFEMSEEQRARARRAGNRTAAFEIILAGLALPLLYVAATVMMFHGFETTTTILVGAGSLACILLGIWLYARNRER